jgi:hypothetical protein
MYALNFYSPMVADQLRSRRKTATIRVGDKSRKYKKGMVVQVLVGARFGPREIEHDNPEMRRPDEMANWLGQLYNRPIGAEDTVTVIRFSEIKNS